MIQHRTFLKAADNSGVRALMCINIVGKGKRRYGLLGDTIQAVVKGADPTGIVKNAEIVRVVLVRTRKERRRPDGSYIRFDDNAGVIVDNQGNPRATRILGPIAREVKERGFNKIASLATEMY